MEDLFKLSKNSIWITTFLIIEGNFCKNWLNGFSISLIFNNMKHSWALILKHKAKQRELWKTSWNKKEKKRKPKQNVWSSQKRCVRIWQGKRFGNNLELFPKSIFSECFSCTVELSRRLKFKRKTNKSIKEYNETV